MNSKIIYEFLEKSILELDGYNQNEFIDKMVTRLNYNYCLFSPSALDTEEEEVNKSKIREFINKHKILSKSDISAFIEDNVSCWDLKYLKEFINKIDLNATRFYYDDKDCSFISINDYYDINGLELEEDIKELINLLKELK